MVRVNFYDPSFVPDDKLIYSVITARYRDKWIFVRHHKRKTYEIPGGHIEDDETPFEAAKRELIEETGAKSFNLSYVCTYSVEKENQTGYGRLFFAEITEIGPVNDLSEIEEVVFLESLPDMLTYPDIQPHLFRRVIRYIQC
jgi:8-oxo-dGTP diphosphatase